MNLQMVEHRPESRVRLMLRQTWLATVGGSLALVGLVALAFYLAAQPATLKVAVGPPNSEDVRVIQAVAQQLARDRAAIRLRPVIKDGAAQSAAALDAGETELAVVRRDLVMPQTGQAIAILRRNHAVLIVPASPPPPAPTPAATPSTPAAAPAAVPPAAAAPAQPAAGKGKGAKKAAVREEEVKKPPAKEEEVKKPKEDEAKKIDEIKKVEHLVGRRVAVIGRTEANVNVLKVILRQYEIQPEKVDVVQIDTTNVGTAIRESNIDAILVVGPLTSRIIADAVAAASHDREAPTFIAVDASEAIAQRVPVYESTEIPAGAFGGAPQKPPEAVETIGFAHYIMARRTLDESTAGEFTRLLFGARQVLTGELTSIGKIEAPDTDKDAVVAVHPGAAAFIDGEQKSFFERYNDWIFYGLMILSFLGSSVAWVMNYTKVDARVRKLHALDRLLELMRAARNAGSVDALEELQAETDDILQATIQQVEYNNLDRTALLAFSLALEQTRGAIAERRAFLSTALARA
jgi:TRAP-type uncharacterized transport system substrate-binding protein